MSEENENVPNNITDNTCGNMEIESDINSIMDLSNQKKSQNINQKKNETNSLNKTAFHSSIKFKTKQKYSSKLKGDSSNQVRYKIKNSLSLKNSLKAHKSKNKQDIEDSKKLSIKDLTTERSLLSFTLDLGDSCETNRIYSNALDAASVSGSGCSTL